MNGMLRLILLFAAAATLCTGCRKKAAPEAASTPRASTPAQATPAEVATGGRTPSATGAPAATPSTPGVPADIIADDATYEAWFKKYNLDLNDAKMLDADADGDGFTNKEEFLADTNPRDASSRPGVHGAIRLKEFTEVRVPFTLRAVDGETAKVERSGEGETKTETVKPGQAIRGSNYKVQEVKSIQTQDKDGQPVDASKVVLEDSNTKQRVELVKDMPVRSTASYAVLTSRDGSTTMTVRQGDVFKWPGDNINYRVLDLRADQVILEQTDGKKNTWTVPKLEGN